MEGQHDDTIHIVHTNPCCLLILVGGLVNITAVISGSKVDAGGIRGDIGIHLDQVVCAVAVSEVQAAGAVFCHAGEDLCCFKVAVGCQQHCFQLCRGAFLVVHTDDICHGAVVKGKAAGIVGDGYRHFGIHLVGVDVRDLNVIQPALFLYRIGFSVYRKAIAVNAVFSGKIMSDGNLRTEHHGAAIVADTAEAAAGSNLRYFCGNGSLGFDLVAGVGQGIGLIIEVKLCLGAVVQHCLNQGLGLVGVVVFQKVMGILLNAIVLCQDIAGAIIYHQLDLRCHLSRCQMDKKVIAVFTGSQFRQGVHSSFVAFNRNGGGCICSFRFYMEVHGQVIAQHQLLSDNLCTCFRSKYAKGYKACYHAQG